MRDLNLDNKGEFKFNDRHKESAKLLLNSLVFWATKMKAARAEMK